MKYLKWLKSEKSENGSMIYCIREKFKASTLFHNPPFKDMRAVWTFPALNLRINRCNEPLSYFFV